MDDVYYFTGTTSQLLAKFEEFDKQANFREDEITFKLTVTRVNTDALNVAIEEIELADPAFTDETVKPA